LFLRLISSLTKDDKIIANQIVLHSDVLVLAPLHAITNVLWFHHQSITEQAYGWQQNAGVQEMAINIPAFRNAIPQCDVFEEKRIHKEEKMKLVENLKNTEIKNTAVTK
jgi:aspartate-semialdehyde dehydrogenase